MRTVTVAPKMAIAVAPNQTLSSTYSACGHLPRGSSFRNCSSWPCRAVKWR
jgi:hypothetical protein